MLSLVPHLNLFQNTSSNMLKKPVRMSTSHLIEIFLLPRTFKKTYVSQLRHNKMDAAAENAESTEIFLPKIKNGYSKHEFKISDKDWGCDSDNEISLFYGSPTGFDKGESIPF